MHPWWRRWSCVTFHSLLPCLHPFIIAWQPTPHDFVAVSYPGADAPEGVAPPSRHVLVEPGGAPFRRTLPIECLLERYRVVESVPCSERPHLDCRRRGGAPPGDCSEAIMMCAFGLIVVPRFRVPTIVSKGGGYTHFCRFTFMLYADADSNGLQHCSNGRLGSKSQTNAGAPCIQHNCGFRVGTPVGLASSCCDCWRSSSCSARSEPGVARLVEAGRRVSRCTGFPGAWYNNQGEERGRKK